MPKGLVNIGKKGNTNHSFKSVQENCSTIVSIDKTNDLILKLTPENVTQHSRIVTTTRKGSSTPTK